MGTPVDSDCSEYTGTSTFTLTDGSKLVLNEYNVILCHPGNSGNTPNFWGNTYGHPNRGSGTSSWTVCDPSQKPYPDPATGCGELINPNDPKSIRVTSGEEFNELTGGTGTNDSFQTNGAILTAAWSGTLTFFP
jgi:hypothetical protein